MRDQVMAVSITAVILLTAIIYTTPSADSIHESQPPNLLIAPENDLIIFPKGGGYDQSYWMQIRSNYSIVEAGINLFGLDVLNSVQLKLFKLVTTDPDDAISTDPQVVTDIYNTYFVAWVDTGSIGTSKEGTDIFVRQWDGKAGNWKGVPFQLSYNGQKTYADHPSLAADSNGNIHAVWYENGNTLPTGGPDNEIFYRKWDGTQWGNIQLLSDDINDLDSVSPEIAVDMYNKVYVVWAESGNIQSSGTDYDIVYRTYNGTAWSATTVISNDPDDGDSIEPAVHSFEDSVYFVWSDNGNISSSGSDYDIIFRPVRHGGLGLPIVASFDIADGDSHNAKLAANDTRTYIAWEDNGPISNSGTDYDIIMTYYNWSNNQFMPCQVVSDDSAFQTSVHPNLILDNYDNLYISWADDGNTAQSGSDWDIYYRILDKFELQDAVLLTDHSTAGRSVNVSMALDIQNNHIQFVWEDSGDLFSSGTDEDIFIKDILFEYNYPTNLKLDIGNDGEWEWNYTENNGILNTNTTIEGEWLAIKLTSLVEAGYSPEKPYVQIPLNFSSDTTGALAVSKIYLSGTHTPQAPTNLHILDEDRFHVIDHQPVITWDFIDSDSDYQGRFNVEVGSAPGLNDMMDPVPTDSAETQFKYLGKTLEDGATYYARVRVADCDGSTWSPWSEPFEFRMNTAPAMTSLTPLSGTFDNSVHLEWSGEDAENDNLLYYVMAFYNSKWHTIVDGSSSTNYTWMVSDLKEGWVDIECYASDGFENSLVYKDGMIYVAHNKPPSLKILSPEMDIKLSDEHYKITWNATDPDSDDLHLSLYYVNVDWFINKHVEPTDKKLIIENLTAENSSYIWNTTDVPEGDYYILGYITDGKASVMAYSNGSVSVGNDPKILPPKILSYTPDKPDEHTSLMPEIKVVFNKAIDITTINHTTFEVQDSEKRLIDGNRTYDPDSFSVNFRLRSPLVFDMTYTVILTSGIKDSDGLNLDINENGIADELDSDFFTYRFTTKAMNEDMVSPLVKSTSPNRDEMNVDTKTTIRINFTEPIEPSTLTSRTFIVLSWNDMLTWDGVSIDTLIPKTLNGGVSYNLENYQAVFTPSSPLDHNTTYVVKLTSEITDLSGNRLESYLFIFTTIPETDDQLPKPHPSSGGKDKETIVEILQWQYFYYVFTALLIILILIATFLIRRRILMGPVSIRDVFIIYNDGRLLYHYRGRELKDADKAESILDEGDDIDESAVSSMLTAIQDFVKDSFRFTRGSSLNELRHGTLRILIEHGSNSYVAVVVGSGSNTKIRNEMKKITFDLNTKYGQVLKKWDGNMNTVAGIDKLVVPLLTLEKDVESK